MSTAELTTARTPQAQRRQDTTTALALAGLAGFALAVVTATALQPSYDPVADTISALAARDSAYPWVAVAGFQFMALGWLAMAWQVWSSLRHTRTGRVAAVLYAVVAIGVAVAGFAQIDCNPAALACRAALEQHASNSTLLHFLAARFVFPPLVAAAMLLAVAVGRGRLRWLVLGAGVTLVGLMVIMNDGASSVAGLVQRIFLVLAFVVPLLAVRRSARRTG